MQKEKERSTYKDSDFVPRHNRIHGDIGQNFLRKAEFDSNDCSSSSMEEKDCQNMVSFNIKSLSSKNLQIPKFHQIQTNDSGSDDNNGNNKHCKHYRASNNNINIIHHHRYNPSASSTDDDNQIGGGVALHHIAKKINDDEQDENKDDDDNDDNDNDKDENEDIIDDRMDYQVFQWIFIISFTFLAVIDRFTINLWPLWVSSPGPIISHNFGVSCFSLISWISSRMLLVSSSYIFLFQNKVFWNWFIEHKWINKYIYIGDIIQINNKLHSYIGIYFVGIPVLLHVWSVIFAALFPQNHVKLYSEWMRPNDNDGNSIPFYSNNLLSLGINDIYRIISTSITFFILIPYSVIRYFRESISWSFAAWIHLFGGIIYTVDLLRMYSHPHCWVFNLPFIIWWIIDRLYGIFYYRRCVATVVNKIRLDDEYLILYLRIPNKYYLLHSIGDIFYFNILECGWDRSHPFTVFWNHKNTKKMIGSMQLNMNWSGHKFSIYNDEHNEDDEQSQYIMSRQSTIFNDNDIHGFHINDNQHIEDNEDDYDWTLGIIMQIIPDHTNCYHRKTWSSEIYRFDSRYFCGLRSWGPFRSEYRMLIKTQNIKKYPLTPLVIIGTGAGCSLLVDFYHYITNNNIKLYKSVQFYFSTRSISMFQWFTDITCHKNINNLFVNAHLTNHDNIIYNKNNQKKTRDSNIGRLNIEEILNGANKNTNVFFCGSPNVQNMVNNLCKKLSLKYHAGHSF